MSKFISDFITKSLDKFWVPFSKELEQIVSNRLLEYVVEEYERNYYTKTIIHRTEPVKLHDFYQPLFISKENNYHVRINTESCKKLFELGDCITLIGTAGSGKSTIVKYLLINSIETNFKVPIKIELRYLNSYNGGLHKYIEEEIFKLASLSFDKKIFKRLLQSGNFLFFFDGYDELGSSIKENITKDIMDFTKIYNTNKYLITSRPYTNIELLTKFKNYEVCRLLPEEIPYFITKQIPSKEKEITNKIINAIEVNQNNGYKTYLSNPLLLSMFILTFQTYSNIPPKKSTFYRQVFDSLFYLHDSVSKLSWSRELKSGLSKEQFEYVLKFFSVIAFFKDAFVFDERFMNSTLNEIKSYKIDLDFDNQDLIDDLQISICILNKEGLDYLFPHRSLQEYFASLHIVSLDLKNKMNFYNQILNGIQKGDLFDLLMRESFYGLLGEQDYFSVIEALTIPILNYILKNLNADKTVDNIENSLLILHTFFNAFHMNDEIIKELFHEIDNYLNSKLVSNMLDKIDIKMEGSFERQLHLDELRNIALSKSKQLIPKTLKVLNNIIKEEHLSNSSIINLIKKQRK